MAADSMAEAQHMPFIKNLASSNRKLRTESLLSLRHFLSSRPSLPPLDARKLWTGLYYALWMTDRPLPQQQLASDLASLLFDLPSDCAAAWLEGFWAVLGTQWPSIEALRMDKFLLLVRRVVAAHVRFASQASRPGEQKDGEGGEKQKLVLDVLRDWPLDAVADLRKVALGLRLHVLDVWVDELHREQALDTPFAKELAALVDALARCPVKSLRTRAQQSCEDPRLPWITSEQEEPEEEEEWDGIDD